MSLYLRALSLAKTSQKTPLELCIFSVYFIIALGGDDATRTVGGWLFACATIIQCNTKQSIQEPPLNSRLLAKTRLWSGAREVVVVEDDNRQLLS